jgi:hypothetical protein
MPCPPELYSPQYLSDHHEIRTTIACGHRIFAFAHFGGAVPVQALIASHELGVLEAARNEHHDKSPSDGGRVGDALAAIGRLRAKYTEIYQPAT